MTTTYTQQMANERTQILKGQEADLKRTIRRLHATRDVTGLLRMLDRVRAELAAG